mgnify:CR=1 FL=1
MMALFDQERAMQLYLRDLLKEKEEEATARGLKRGIEQGIEQTEIRHIYEMKKEGIPIEVIARVIGKSIEEIQSMDLQDK